MNSWGIFLVCYLGWLLLMEFFHIGKGGRKIVLDDGPKKIGAMIGALLKFGTIFLCLFKGGFFG